MLQPTLTGKWDDNQSWGFYQTDKLPAANLCTAVYCLAILPRTNQVVLTRNHRGWEMLGGHIEPGETVEQTLVRECLEEGGFIPETYRLFGYRKITARKPVSHSQRGGCYPFPHGYIPHYIAISTLPLQKPTGEEILESRAFTVQDISGLDMAQRSLLEAGLAFYKTTLSSK